MNEQSLKAYIDAKFDELRQENSRTHDDSMQRFAKKIEEKFKALRAGRD